MDTVIVTDAMTGEAFVFNIKVDNNRYIEDQVYEKLEEKYGKRDYGSIEFFVAKKITMEIDLC